MFPLVSVIRTESIGGLLVEIGWKGEKLVHRVFWFGIPIGGVFQKVTLERIVRDFNGILRFVAPRCANSANLSKTRMDG
jgi:hypothetical protein